ncbi:unnamed protein product, partial [Rotaria socialis]
EETSSTVLSIGNYSGDAGDGLMMPSDEYYIANGMQFSTHDQDNDLASEGNCAKNYRGAWWFNKCGFAHLNGYPHVAKNDSSYDDGKHSTDIIIL